MKDKRYEIMNIFIDRYENSAAFKGTSTRKRKIQLKLYQVYPHYGKSEYYLETEEIEEAVNALLKLNFIKAGQNSDFGHRDIVLNTDEQIIRQIYHFLGRTDLKYAQHQFLSALSQYQAFDWINNFLHELEVRTQHFQSLYPYLETNSVQELQDIITILNYMQSPHEEISYRKFSIMTLQDSKKLELYKHKIYHIIHDFYDDTISNENEAFEVFGIIRNPSIVYVKGKMRFQIDDQLIDLKNFNYHFSFYSDYITQIEIIDIHVQKIMTVENWTSFNDLELEDTLIIYLGGFHNTAISQFLLKIYKFLDDQVKYYHFGDIDAGGFYIYLNLLKKTNIPFQTWKMNLVTLKHYEQYAKPLTQNDIARLKKLKNDINDPVIDYMLEKNVKLEQEIISIE
ncbi:hypothetical protein H5999_00600 [[Clostridium] spiroforme]|nr:hypothetical protein [Thomasclavelia spiroformis]